MPVTSFTALLPTVTPAWSASRGTVTPTPKNRLTWTSLKQTGALAVVGASSQRLLCRDVLLYSRSYH